MAWHDHAADVVIDVSCGAEQHPVRWHRGELVVEAHDLEAERVLAAFGGEPPGCVTYHALWRDAIADGAFLAEWARWEHHGATRRAWLETALRRLRAEGVQDFLPGVSLARADRLGTALVTLPAPLLDRAALTVVAERTASGHLDGSKLAVDVADALRLRARDAFVRSLARHAHVRPAALVRFDCEVDLDPAAPPLADGVLVGRSGWCRLRLPVGWLVEAWGRGAALAGGDLVVAAGPEPAPGQLHVTTLRWERTPARPGVLLPRLVEGTLRRLGTAWVFGG